MVRREPGAVIVGLGLLAIGGWLILRGLGAPLLGLRHIWPALLALFGVALLAQNTGRDHPSAGLLWMGTMIVLSSALLGAFSLQLGGLGWRQLFGYWPAFVLIAAVAFLLVGIGLQGGAAIDAPAAVPGGLSAQGLLTLAVVLGAIALSLLPVTLGAIHPPMATPLYRLLPLALVAAMLVIYLVARWQRRRHIDG